MTGPIVVTGATTPFGRALVRSLVDDPATGGAIAVVRPDEQHGFEDGPRLTVVPCDLLRPRSISDLLHGPARARGASAVVHAAFHRRARDTGPAIRRLNVEATRELLRGVEGHPSIEQFVLMSHAEVYRTRADEPSIIREDHPLELSPEAPQWVRDRVEADLIACTRMGMADARITVLRCAECLMADMGSQLHDYLSSRVCFRALGFDPMLTVISLVDLVGAARAALASSAQGIFNIPGADTLPLSAAIARSHRLELVAPGPLLLPLYGLRALVDHSDFRYDQNAWRFHYSAVLDGRRAAEMLGWSPRHPLDWR